MGFFDRLVRSWELLKLSFSITMQDKEMLLFPMIGGIFSSIFSFLMIWPTFLVELTAGGQEAITLGVIEYVFLFVTYFGVAFIATFFNVCVTYTVKTRLDGGDATFKDSIMFALSRVHLIAAWSAVSASVGVALRALESAVKKQGGLAEVIGSIMLSLIGGAWAILTVFVVPALVYEEVGPIDALKSSAEAMRKTWGESLVAYFGFGSIQFLAMLPGIAMFFGGIAMGVGGLAAGTPIPLVVGLIGLGVLWMIVAGMFCQLLLSVFHTTLYNYARTGEVPDGAEVSQYAEAFAPAPA